MAYTWQYFDAMLAEYYDISLEVLWCNVGLTSGLSVFELLRKQCCSKIMAFPCPYYAAMLPEYYGISLPLIRSNVGRLLWSILVSIMKQGWLNIMIYSIQYFEAIWAVIRSSVRWIRWPILTQRKMICVDNKKNYLPDTFCLNICKMN